MRFKHVEINFEATYKGHQNCSKTYDLKLDLIMCEPHCVQVFFNLTHTQGVPVFILMSLYIYIK